MHTVDAERMKPSPFFSTLLLRFLSMPCFGFLLSSFLLGMLATG
jgi:hypothetical protein